MAYTKKTWVNVPDPSKPPSIPEGQDDLARFDAENMNRIEEGVEEAHAGLANIEVSLDHGGGKVGVNALSTNGGFSGGHNALSKAGGSIGYNAETEHGGAVGNNAKSNHGGSVGKDTITSDGFAGGYNAKAINANGDGINAIQLGTGTNTTPKTLQVYNHQLMKADGTIPDERMPTKAPSGHGLGRVGDTKNNNNNKSYQEFLRHGCGFYQVNSDDDAPDGIGSWMSLLQVVRNPNEGAETGAQMAFNDLDTKSRMWFRTVRAGTAQPWTELLHSGNYKDFDGWVTLGSASSSGTKNYSNNNQNDIYAASILIPIDESIKEKYTSFRLILKAGSYMKALAKWNSNSSSVGKIYASMSYCNSTFASVNAFGGNIGDQSSENTIAELNISKDEVVYTYSPEGITTGFTASALLGNESVTTKSISLLNINAISMNVNGLKTNSDNYVEWQVAFELQGRK